MRARPSLPPYDRITEVSDRLISLAKETGALVIACSQLTAAKGQQAPLPVPKADQIRGSGDVWQDADLCIVFHRPWALADGGKDKINELAIVEIGKNRYGSIGHVVMRSDGAINAFDWWEEIMPEDIPGLTSMRIYNDLEGR